MSNEGMMGIFEFRFSIFDWFRARRQARVVAAWIIVPGLLVLPGCDRGAKKEEKALRAELRKAIDQQAYERAVELARKHLKLRPHDNGTWDRLVRAQFALHDLAAVSQSLDDWRNAVPEPSQKLDEYAGDYAAAKKDSPWAAAAWKKAASADPKNIRIWEKIARIEAAQNRWAQVNDAWTAYIAVQDTAMARINRALCRRRLHRWPEAFEDLERARVLGPDDPEVLRGGKFLDQAGRFLADIRELDSALALSPNDPGLLADRALVFLRCEDYELALEDAEAAGNHGPWAMRPKLFQALALIALGQGDECEKLGVHPLIFLEALTPEFLETIGRLDSEISAEPNNAELHVSRAWQLNEIGQPALALQDAETAARLDPKASGACAEASYALTKLGRAAEARDQIKRATELDPNFATAWQYRGELEMARGETLSAIESFTHAIEANQTALALQKREQCYRRLGLLVKAEQDRKAREELARAPK
jgi:tetratricopeptide (TPR) repeat protein